MNIYRILFNHWSIYSFFFRDNPLLYSEIPRTCHVYNIMVIFLYGYLAQQLNMIITNLFVFFLPLIQYTNSNNRIPAASSPANTNSSSSSNTNGGASLQSSNQPTTSSPSSECQSGAAAQQLSKTNLYIRGLSQNTLDKDLVTMCSQWVQYYIIIITIIIEVIEFMLGVVYECRVLCINNNTFYISYSIPIWYIIKYL